MFNNPRQKTAANKPPRRPQALHKVAVQSTTSSSPICQHSLGGATSVSLFGSVIFILDKFAQLFEGMIPKALPIYSESFMQPFRRKKEIREIILFQMQPQRLK